MFAEGIRIRSFHAGCAHEVKLPGGKTLLIDPFFRDSLSGGHTMEEVEGADYILVTHTHFDHELDLGYFAKKFHSLVFVGALSAFALLKYHGLAYDNVIPVYSGQTYAMKDFSLQIVGAKHNPSGGKTYSPETDIAKEAAGTEGHQECDTFGSMESVDYLLTTPSGFRLMTVSGRTVWDEPFEISREKCPDLLLRQAGVRRDGGSLFSGEQVTARELAELLVRYRAKIYMPFHMDVIYKRWGKEKTEEYFKEVGRFVRELSAGSEFLFPEPWKWYRLGTAVEEEA